MNSICLKNNIEFYNNFELKNFSTLKVSSVAQTVIFIKNVQELCTVLSEIQDYHLLGAGSNVLFSSLGVKEPVILTKKMSDISFSGDIVEIEAGAMVQKLSKLALDNSLSGFEFFIGIPATMGGAVAMNAGAHLQSVCDTLISAKLFDSKEKKIVELTNEELKFSYRNSLIKRSGGRYSVVSAKFKLKKEQKEKISAKMQENTDFRKRAQPNLSLPNIGSVFKNPLLPDGEKLSAGMLIDKCALRGFISGGAKIWENHANFVINYNNCTSSDYTNAVFKMYDSVKKKFNIELEPEIIYAGKMSDSEEEKWKIMKKN